MPRFATRCIQNKSPAVLLYTSQNLTEKIKAFDIGRKHANTEYGKALLEVADDLYNQVQQLWNEAVESGLEAAHTQTAENKKAANEGGVMEQARDVESITDEKAEELLEWAEYGEFYDNTYLPMRKDTPLILINSTKNLDTGEISNHPMIISVKKARQALTPIGEYYKGAGKGHGLERNQIVSAIRNIDNPKRLFYEKENNRYAVLVSYEGSKGKQALIPLDVDQNIKLNYMNGYSGGAYNVAVSVFNQENIKTYESDKNHVEIDLKRKDAPQRGSSSSVLSHLNETSFSNSISQTEQNSNTSTQKIPTVSPTPTPTTFPP